MPQKLKTVIIWNIDGNVSNWYCQHSAIVAAYAGFSCFDNETYASVPRKDCFDISGGNLFYWLRNPGLMNLHKHSQSKFRWIWRKNNLSFVKTRRHTRHTPIQNKNLNPLWHINYWTQIRILILDMSCFN